MTTAEMNAITMAEAVVEVQKIYEEKLGTVPKGVQLNNELKGYIAFHHQKNQLIVLENEYAKLKEGKRSLVETGLDEIINQVLLYANMENKPEIKVKVDLYYKDIHSVGGDKLLDTATKVRELALELGAVLNDYRGPGITPEAFKVRIDDFAALLLAPRMDTAARSAINKEMKANVKKIREFLNEKMNVAMKIMQQSEPEFYNAYDSARVIVDRHGKRKAGKPTDETTGMISGTITDLATGEPVEDVIVQLEGVEDATTTDENGEFAFDVVVPGICNLTCIKETYKNLQLTGVEVKAGEECEVEGTMEKE